MESRNTADGERQEPLTSANSTSLQKPGQNASQTSGSNHLNLHPQQFPRAVSPKTLRKENVSGSDPRAAEAKEAPVSKETLVSKEKAVDEKEPREKPERESGPDADDRGLRSQLRPAVLRAESRTEKENSERMEIPAPVVLDKQLLSKLNKTLKEKQRVAKNPTTIQDLAKGAPEPIVEAEVVAETSDREEPRRRKRVAKQTSTRTDFFAAKLASAVDDVELSDSDETFVYESNTHPAANQSPAEDTENINQPPHLIQLVNDNISVAGSVTPLETPVTLPGTVPPANQPNTNHIVTTSSAPPALSEAAPVEDDARESVHLVQLSKWNLRNTFGANTTPPTALRLQYSADFSNPYATDRVARRKSSVHLLFGEDKTKTSELAHPGLSHNLSQPLLYQGGYIFDEDGLSDELIHSEVEPTSSASHRSAAPSLTGVSRSASLSANGNNSAVGNPPGTAGNAGSSTPAVASAAGNPGLASADSGGPNSGAVGSSAAIAGAGISSATSGPPPTLSTTTTPNPTVERKSKTLSTKLRSTTSKLFDKTGTQPRRYSTIPDDFDIEDFDDELIYYDNNNIRFPYYSQNNSMNDSTLLLANAKIPHYRSMNFPGRRNPSNNKGKRYMSAGYVPNGFGKNKKGDIFPFAGGADPNNFYYDIDEYDEHAQSPTDKTLMPTRSHLGSLPRFVLPRKVSNDSLASGRCSYFRSFLVTCISFLLILSIGFFLGFLLASTKDLSNISIVSIENALVSQDELVFTVVVEALNPGWFTVSVSDIDIDIFAKSGYLDDSASDSASNSAVETVLLGSVYNFESAITFKGGLFSREVLQEIGEIKLVGPGKNLTGLALRSLEANKVPKGGDNDQPDNSEKWETISKHPFDLILRGVLKYNLPLTSSVKSAVVNKIGYIDPSLSNTI